MRAAFVIIAALSLGTSIAAADETVSRSLSASSARSGVRRVVVDLPPGELNIRNGPSDTIRVSGEVRRDYDGYRQREKQQEILNDIGVEIAVSGDEALIRATFGPNARNWSARHHTEFRTTIDVPVGLDVDVETRYGELQLDGSFGNIHIDMGAGEIRLRTPRANVRELTASVRIGEVHANLGDSSEVHEGIFPGSTHFINVGGRSKINVHTTVGELHVTLTR